MLTENDQKEQLSYAYVHAVAASAGFSCQVDSVDRDGIDVTIKARGRLDDGSISTSPRLEAQLKATSVVDDHNGTIAYDVPVDNYNALIEPRATPAILVVLVMPEDSASWLFNDEEGLVARKCAYWVDLKGMNRSENRATKRVHIPTCNILTADVLRRMMTNISKMEGVSNGI